ncbi:MAG: hypothetical protein ABI855_06680 [Bacteroidota bacterium]
MKNCKPRWIIKKGNLETDEDIWIYEEDPEILLLETRGLSQKEIRKWIGKSEKFVKNHIENINRQTGVTCPKERVIWALRVEILIVVDRMVVIATQYIRKEKDLNQE